TAAVEHMIFGREKSQAVTAPATQMKITVDTREVDGKQVAVINIPDWLSSELSTEEIQQNIQFYINLIPQKPYTLLLVIPVKQFKEKEREMEKKIKEIFQDRLLEMPMILFTATNEQEEEEIQKRNLKRKWGIKFHVLKISQNVSLF
ncbi:hypothetical protein M9458_011414, partial [Cirrhinus mrigala]